MADETQPLLSSVENGTNSADSTPSRPLRERLVAIFKAEGEPSFFESFKWFFFASWVNVLLVFIPLSFLSHQLNWDAALRFTFSFMAIVPLAKLLGDATEQMSAKLGPTLAGLLNASFGNAVEIIVGVAALLQALVIPAAYNSTQAKNGEDTDNSSLHATIDTGIPDLDAPAEDGLLVISRGTAILLLVVASIEETAERYHIPKTFIGLILLPIVGNAAEHVTAIFMALKDKMEITIGVCVGSSIVSQIAAFVIPLMVIIGWITGHPLTLFFANFETVVFFASVLLVNTLLQDGLSNYMEGIMLVTLYLVISLAFWVA
ncbi:hypothetical protein DXG01_016418 [Tephrocybe rancida]|nr:hypothetical protein DXG01_016418 [Tephrocybe rancida]